ncbi:HNH endonuclease [Mycobacterium paraintracellulare]|uniref:HNH endonuclease n=1 Tax=Mycobacterium paraintracellulare TaxID=1138383 RepID=A0ABM7KEB8_9MYCO|nr:HNH endonuclease [Mycobacterium paraintracellulare]BBY72452.1 hypothetical protein MPRI_46390 [Mycobacterium paraintracellulare]
MGIRGDPRNSAAWQRLRKQVIREEPLCQIGLPGCTGKSTSADHIISVLERPDLALVRTNCRGACAYCNAVLGGRITPKPMQRKAIAQDMAARSPDWLTAIRKHVPDYVPANELAEPPPALAFFDTTELSK